MIASPSDVPTERRLAAEVIHEWNAIHADDRKIVLLPVSWETHSAPSMGDRPQAVINRQVLQNCDLLVAIFWTRLGSPTGASASGTVEEVEEHIAAAKPAMIYFSSAPVRPDSVNEEQYRALKEFRAKCRSRGLIEEFESLAEFREKFARQLAQTVLREFAKVEDIEDLSPQMPEHASPNRAKLSDAARNLLVEAAKDRSGTIICVAVIGGYHVQTNGKDFVERGNPRSEALWRGAVSELRNGGLIEDRGHNEEVFAITDEGYRVADLLQ